MVRFQFRPKRCTAQNVKELVIFINEHNLQQNENLRKAFETLSRDIEDLKKEKKDE